MSDTPIMRRIEPAPEEVQVAVTNLEAACKAWPAQEVTASTAPPSEPSPYANLCSTVLYGDLVSFAFWFGVCAGILGGVFVLRPVVRWIYRYLRQMGGMVRKRRTA